MIFTGLRVISCDGFKGVVNDQGELLVEIKDDPESERVIISMYEKVPLCIHTNVPLLEEEPLAISIGQSLSSDTDEYVAIVTKWENVITMFE